MPGAVNAKLYHDQVKNMFSAGSAAATNSPLAYLEKTSNYTAQLLKEQAAANDNIAKQLNTHTKLLEKLVKGTNGSLGLTDLIMSRYIAKFLSGATLAVGGAVTGVIGGGKALFGAGLRGLQSGVKQIFAKTGGLILNWTRSFLDEGLRVIQRVGRPVMNIMAKLTSLAEAGGLISMAAKLGGTIAKSGGLLLRSIGKLAWPITALLGVIDGISGWMRADKDLGRGGKVNLFRKLEYAKAAVVNGLLLGLPDYISKKLTGKGYGKLIDDSITTLTDGLASYTKNFRQQFWMKMSTAQERLRDIWAMLPTREEFKGFATEIRGVVMGLGSYIKSGFTGMVDDLRSWFGELFNWRPWDTRQPSWESPEFQDAMRPKPRRPAGVTSTTPGTGDAERRMQQRLRRTPIIQSTQTVPRIVPAPSRFGGETHPTTNQILRTTVPDPARFAPDVTPMAQDAIETGISTMEALGQALVRSNAELALKTAKETGKTAGKEIAEGVSQTFGEQLSNSGMFKNIISQLTKQAKEQFNQLFNKQNLTTLGDILGGTSPSADFGSLMGADTIIGPNPADGTIIPGQFMPNATTGIGGSRDVGGGVPGTSGNTGQAAPSSPMPNRPSWWDQTKIGPQLPGPRIGSLPPAAFDTTGGIPGNSELNPTQRALLDTIAGPESAGKYNVIYGGSKFSDYSDHPRKRVMIRSGPNAGRYSSAAGKYQFLAKTWDQYKDKLGLKDFSPASQDAAAWELAKDVYKQNTGNDLETALKSGDPETIAGVGRTLRGTWTSLPGGIEQGTTTSKFVSTYNKNLARDTTIPAEAYANTPAGAIEPFAGTKGVTFAHPDQAAGLDPRMSNVLTGLSERIGGNVNVTSAYRSPARNKAVGGSRGSYHVKGLASDIDMSGMSTEQRKYMAANLIKLGVGGLITYTKSPNMLHADMRSQGGDGLPHFMHDRKNKYMDNAPAWFQEMAKMSPEEIDKIASTVVPGMAAAIAEQKPGGDLADSPMFGSLLNKSPKSSAPTTKSSNRFGDRASASAYAEKTSSMMNAGMSQPSFFGDQVAGTSNIATTSNRVEPKSQMAAVEKAINPVSSPNPVLDPVPNKSTPLTPVKEPVQMVQPVAPPIKTVPTTDELRMLSVNSELLQ